MPPHAKGRTVTRPTTADRIVENERPHGQAWTDSGTGTVHWPAVADARPDWTIRPWLLVHEAAHASGDFGRHEQRPLAVDSDRKEVSHLCDGTADGALGMELLVADLFAAVDPEVGMVSMLAALRRDSAASDILATQAR